MIEEIAHDLELLRDAIRARMEETKENASHRTEQSLQVIRYDGGVKLVSAEGDHAPLGTLEIGREGGKVPYNFQDILYQWSNDKCISMDERERRKFANALKWKIAKSGTDRHANNVDIYYTLVSEYINYIKADVTKLVKKSIKLNF